MKVTVVGAGNVGASCAEYIAQNEISSKVVLLDIKEGFAAGLLFSIGGLSFIILDKGHDVLSGKMVRYLLLFSGLTMLGISYFGILLIMNTKLPQYLIYT